MPLQQIKNRFSGKVIFEGEFLNMKLCVEAAVGEKKDLGGANLRDANLRGANLRDAYLRDAYLGGANLRDAYLGGAYLGGANLGDAYLSGAYLGGAYLGDGITAEIQPLQLFGLCWDIYIFDNHMKIACETHPIAEWDNYDDERISEMDAYALKFWQEHKLSIMTLAKSHMEKAADQKAEAA